MAQDRPDIPADLKRSVLVEAGHRCAIPTCRQTPVELAHIVPWAKVKEHAFANLIALCPTCHTRYDRGEIDRKSILQYKVNLGVLNSRYTQVERQLLKVVVSHCEALYEARPREGQPLEDFIRVLGDQKGAIVAFSHLSINGDMWWLLSNLIEDGMVKVKLPFERPESASFEASHISLAKESTAQPIFLTAQGIDLVARMVAAQPI